MSTRIRYSTNLPSATWLKRHLRGSKDTKFLIIFDRKLKNKGRFAQWVRQFPLRYGVVAGEKLKSMELFSHHAHRLNKIAGAVSGRALVVVSVGGGSVGDFAGFFASVYKRGVGLVHLPSTWLAAIDSAHGGKTGLNLAGAKNQIGTFYPASMVVMCRSLLASQNPHLHQAAYAELYKISLLAGGSLYKQTSQLANLSTNALWEVLPKSVAAKNKIVGQDPQEKKGYRQILNLGHTVGHALESFYDIPHGMAVALGLKFALNWGERLGTTSVQTNSEIQKELESRLGLSQVERQLRRRKRIPAMTLKRLLHRDKKMASSDQVTFVFLDKIGKPRREKVTVSSVLREMRRQGW
ncbi:MAG: 3-dehydroquinate synthase [Bdellovibrionales bacterium]|nr:3-dehydroquinate synthase [Bdellovibrionales bacterium]